MEAVKLTKGQRVAQAFATVGFASGIYLAYRYKKGFWSYVGYAIGLSIAGSIIGSGIGRVAFGTMQLPSDNGNKSAKVDSEAGAETAKKI